MKVVLILWSGELGGSERHVFDLALHLPRYGIKPVVCFLANKAIYGDLLEKAMVETKEICMKSGHDLSGYLHYLQFLRSGNFDIVHVHTPNPLLRVLTRIFHPKMRIVYTEHSGKISFNYWQLFWSKFSDRSTDIVVAVSQKTATLYCQLYKRPLNSLVIIPNFVDLTKFTQMSAEKASEVRYELGIFNGSFLLLSIGRLVKNKGYDRLIHIIAPLLHTHPNIYLAIVGEGQEHQLLEKLIQQFRLERQIKLLGNRLDIPDLLSACHVFVMSSRDESFGIVVLEAMSVCRPVIAIRIPGLDEVIVDGKTGFLIEDFNLESQFNGAIIKLLENPEIRKEMGKAGRNRVEDYFALDQVIDKIVFHCYGME